MSDIRLYLNDELVTIDPSTIISETKQINNLFELKDRQTDFTNNFTVLLDNETSAILDRLGDTYNTSLKPYRHLTPKLYRGGRSTIVDGKFVIKNVKKRKKLTGSIQSGNVSLFDAMGSDTLASLDLSELDHQFSESTVLGSYGNTWENGYIYALSNFGLLDFNSIDLSYQNPSVYFKWLWEKLFEFHGYTYSYRGDNNPFESSHFKTMILTLDKGFEYDDTTDTSENIVDISAEGSIDNSAFIGYQTETIDTDGIHNLSSGGFSFIGFEYSGFYRVDIEGDSTEGAVISVLGKDVVLINETSEGSFTKTSYGYFEKGDYLLTQILTNTEVEYNINLKIYKNDGVNTINFSNYLTSIKQTEFFKSVLQTYGLMMQKVKGENHFEFITMNEMFTNREDAQDFSEQYHNTRAPNISFRFGNYGQKNTMKYSYDNDESSFADGNFFIDDETLNDSVDMFVMPYKAPARSNVLIGSDSFYLTTLYDVSFDDLGNVTDVKSKSSKPYIGRVKNIDTTINYEISKEGLQGSYTGSVPLFSFDNQSFTYLISKYYGGFVATINRTKVFDVELELLPSHVANFDFLNLVYLRQEQKYFYCNKISSYSENKVTKVQLIEVNTSIQTYGEYSDDYNNDYTI